MITKDKARQVTEEIQIAVDAILKKHNLEKIKVSTTYGDSYAFKVQASEVTIQNGVNVETPQAQMWRMLGRTYGFENPNEALGTTFAWNGKKFIFLGVTSRGNYPVIAKNSATKKDFKLPIRALQVIEGFNKKLTIVSELID